MLLYSHKENHPLLICRRILQVGSLLFLPVMLIGAYLNDNLIFWAGLGFVPVGLVLFGLLIADDFKVVRFREPVENGKVSVHSEIISNNVYGHPMFPLGRLSLYDTFFVLKTDQFWVVPFDSLINLELRGRFVFVKSPDIDGELKFWVSKKAGIFLKKQSAQMKKIEQKTPANPHTSGPQRLNVRQEVRMPLDANILRKLIGFEVPKSRAWRVFREWGPKLRIDRFERLKAKFPKESQETIRGWMDDFDTVEKTIWRIASAGGREFHSEEKCRNILSAAHPWMSAKSITKALGLADYLAWHEGYHVTPEENLEENQA